MWTQLLRKDARQVLPSISFCTGIIVIVQIVSYFAFLYQHETIDFGFYNALAFVGPVLAALACAGMSIGNERQSRTMHWMSSLPVPWHVSLLSQLLVSLLGIVTVAITTFTIAAVIPDARRYDSFLPQNESDYATLPWLLTYPAIVAEIYVFSILFLLIIDEPLYGLAAAGFATLFVNITLCAIWEGNFEVEFFRTPELGKLDAGLKEKLSELDPTA